MGKRLTQSEIGSFHEHGYLPGVDVFSEEECGVFRSKVEAFERARPEAVGWAFDIKTNLLFDWVYELSGDPRLLDLIEDLIGPDVLLTDSIFRIKEPGSATFYGWHQDAARIQVEPGFVLAFIAISEATPDNGCLRLIPDSHHEVHPYTLVGYSHRQLARVREVDESQAVDLVLAKGQVGLLHCNTIHGLGQEPHVRAAHRARQRLHPALGAPVVGHGVGPARARCGPLEPLRSRAGSSRRVHQGGRTRPAADPERIPRERSHGAARTGRRHLVRG